MKEAIRDLDNFDWSGHRCIEPMPIISKEYRMMSQNESHYDRCVRMLSQVQKACVACSMCELGRRSVTRDDKIYRDPHVFSNMNPTRFMVVGQNPGWDEVVNGTPFVGDAWTNFNNEIEANGLSRKDFYICNTIRCYTDKNAKPTAKHVQRCEPFLHIEMNVIRPLLVAALGAVSFARLCPEAIFSESLGSVVYSDRYDTQIFAIYHPSPMNMCDQSRAAAFKKQIRVFCKIVKRLQQEAAAL